MPAAGKSVLGRAGSRGERLQRLGRSSALAAFGLGIFALVLLVSGKNPLKAYADIFTSTLGSWYGLSETLVKMIPLVLAAVAVAVPAQIWLINVGGEGQRHVVVLVLGEAELARSEVLRRVRGPGEGSTRPPGSVLVVSACLTW